MSETITGLILTYNGERLLDKCLASLDFCDEILVVDSQSTDRTRAIAESFDAKVLVRQWEGPVPQFIYALDKIKTKWVVSLDQDEFLSPKLRRNVIKAIEEETDLAGYYLPRRSFYFNRFMKHSGWYPDHLFRLFKLGNMEVTASGAHYHFKPLGPTAKLQGDIVHYPYSNFREHMDKINSYAQQGADDLRSKGRKGGLFRALVHAKVRFFKLYVLKLGFLDGRAGFINALAGFHYTFQKYIRIEEKGDWSG